MRPAGCGSSPDLVIGAPCGHLTQTLHHCPPKPTTLIGQYSSPRQVKRTDELDAQPLQKGPNGLKENDQKGPEGSFARRIMTCIILLYMGDLQPMVFFAFVVSRTRRMPWTPSALRKVHINRSSATCKNNLNHTDEKSGGSSTELFFTHGRQAAFKL